MSFLLFADQTSWTTFFASLLETCLCDPARLPEYFPCGQVREWVCAQMYISSCPPPSSDTLSLSRAILSASGFENYRSTRVVGTRMQQCDGSGRFPRFRATERPPNYSISEIRFVHNSLFFSFPRSSSSALTFALDLLILSWIYFCSFLASACNMQEQITCCITVVK